MSGASSVAIDSAGNVFIAASHDQVIDEVPSGHNNAPGLCRAIPYHRTGGDNARRLPHTLPLPVSIVFDKSDNLYVADATNHSVRMITAEVAMSRRLSDQMVRGCTAEASCGDGGPAAVRIDGCTIRSFC